MLGPPLLDRHCRCTVRCNIAPRRHTEALTNQVSQEDDIHWRARHTRIGTGVVLIIVTGRFREKKAQTDEGNAELDIVVVQGQEQDDVSPQR